MANIPFVAEKSDVENTVVFNDGDLVDVTLSTKWNGSHVRCEWRLDFSTCTRNELLELAKRSIVITEQSRMRRAKRDELADLAKRSINVHDAMVVERGGGRAPTLENTVKRAEKLTLEEQKALLEQLTALMYQDA